MRARGQDSVSTPGPGVEAGRELWLCPVCRGIHAERRCPRDDRPGGERRTCLDGPLHLCACCSRTTVVNEGPSSSLFCAECAPRVTEMNTEAGQLVVPVNRADRKSAASARRWELLATASFRQTAELLWALRIQGPVWVKLDDYLRQVATLRADRFQPSHAFRDLASLTCELVIEIPEESPALRTRIRDAAQTAANALCANDARELLALGPSALREAARLKAWNVLDSVLPLPSFLPADDPLVQTRRSHTVLSLIGAIVHEVESVHGPARRPTPPTRPPGLEICVLESPDGAPADVFPDDPGEDGYFIVGLQGPPSDPDAFLVAYHLSRDATRSRWLFWADAECEEEEGFFAPAPAASCEADRLGPEDAAYFLLRDYLEAQRRVHGLDRPRPNVEMKGLLHPDLVDVLLDDVWRPSDRSPS